MALDDGLHGTTELRVHGVSGTPPDNILQMPPAWIRLVHGGTASGFFRRWVPDGTMPPSEPGVDRVEAYSWGGLTSGSATRSLWLLVLPFTLVDVAHWMMPLLPPGASRHRKRVVWASLAILRVLSLSLTLTGVVAFALVSQDLAGWQCGSVGRCTDAHAYVGWLSALDRPEQRVAAMTILPSLLLLLVWLIGRSRIEAQSAPDPVVKAGDRSPLSYPTFFAVDPGVVRLRRLHVIASASLLAAIALAPVARYADNDRWSRTLIIVTVVVGGLAGLAAFSQRLAGRGRPGKDDDGAWADWPTRIAQLLSVAILVAALVTAFATHTHGEPVISHLPGMRGVILGLFGVQLALIPLLLATVALQHHDRGVRAGAVALIAVVAFAAIVMLYWAIHQIGKDHPDHRVHVPHGVYTALILVGLSFAFIVTRAAHQATKPVTFVTPTDTPGPMGMPPPAAGGLGAPLVATLAWLYSLALSAGVGLQVAQLLGHPVTNSTAAAAEQTAYETALNSNNVKALQTLGDTPLIVPPGFIWASIGALSVALIAVAIGAYVFLVSLPRRRALAAIEAGHDYADEGAAHEAASARALASLVDDAGVFAGVFVSATLVSGFALLVGYLHFGQDAIGGSRGPLAGIGSWIIVGFVGALLGLGYASLRNRKLRRSVGILWDVCTFWPRANHPFTPPPYTECAVPELIGRIKTLSVDPTDQVVLSAHSQGSVIAVPVVLQLEAEQVERVRLLLHGSPVSRLYARWFPAYFCDDCFGGLRERLPGRWRTLYRRTDYIGGWNVTRDPGRAASYAVGPPRVAAFDQVDQEVPDPPIAGGPARRHSDYWLEPIYTATVASLLAAPESADPQSADPQQMDVRQRTESPLHPAKRV